MATITATIRERIQDICDDISRLPEDEAIDLLNEIRLALHAVSPLRDHPVDCVLWIKQEQIHANAYNPNQVAPPEMKLLERSIKEDGWTQPAVAWQEDDASFEIVDGYHRSLVGGIPVVYNSVCGRLPITLTNQGRTDLADRMASTIRHNRARGTHSIELMQHIVAELVECGMSDRWIMRHIGMDADELLRLKQLTGLAALFANAEFSQSWSAQFSDGLEEE